ncbi:hypothetical protein IG631_23616 [Alternaria alternata]|nr:hypothetical protein IG631_23616 [Alternaria alternata]
MSRHSARYAQHGGHLLNGFAIFDDDLDLRTTRSYAALLSSIGHSAVPDAFAKADKNGGRIRKGASRMSVRNKLNTLLGRILNQGQWSIGTAVFMFFLRSNSNGFHGHGLERGAQDRSSHRKRWSGHDPKQDNAGILQVQHIAE